MNDPLFDNVTDENSKQTRVSAQARVLFYTDITSSESLKSVQHTPGQRCGTGF